MKKIVVLTGAGISAESGISTFRDSNGLWENYPVQDVASIDGFKRNPALVLDFYNERRKAYKGCKPNKGHLSLATLEEYFEVTIITQNVDNLHEDAGSSRVIHLHGELMKNRSVQDPYTTYPVDPIEPDLHIGDLAPDGSQLRPFIVWFGENVPMIIPAIEETKKADIFVVIGTSLEVYPATSLLDYLSSSCPIYMINPNYVAVGGVRNVQYIQKPATQGVPELVVLLKEKYLS